MELLAVLTMTARRESGARCAHCDNSGIVESGGREWRCGFCGRRPRRQLRTKRKIVFELPKFDPNKAAEAREIDLGARTQACGVETCTELTTNKKPFCQTHMDRLKHADSLSAEIARREVEEQVAATGVDAWRSVDVAGSRAQEILGVLETQGSQTPERLATLSGIKARAIAAYVKALEQAGRVQILRFSTDHGPKVMVSLAR